MENTIGHESCRKFLCDALMGDGLEYLGVLAVVCGAYCCWRCSASQLGLFLISNALSRFTLQLSLF